MSVSAARRTPVQGRSQVTVRKVRDAAAVLLARGHGVEMLTTAQIAAIAGVSVGALYRFFPDKQAIVDAIALDHMAAFEEALASARTIVWNGPLGVFEVPTFGDGTRAMARFLSRHAQAGNTVVVGGGDSEKAIKSAGVSDKISHISTGGGASLEFLSGLELPGVAALPTKK